MEIKAAVLTATDASSPYAASKPLTLETLELDPPGPGEAVSYTHLTLPTTPYV